MNRLTQISFTAAPAALLGGWLLMRPTGADIAGGPWWTAAYVACLAGFLMFGVMTLGLRGMAGPVRGGRRVAVEAATGVALLSLAAAVVRLGIDLYAGLGGDQGAGFEAIVYGTAAQVFFGALVALAVILAALRRVTVVSAAVTTLGMVVLAVGMYRTGREAALAAVGIALMWLGTLLLGRGTSGQAPRLGQGVGSPEVRAGR
ncbi:hypothetical protein [Nonomuraea sp. NPDC049784]|uniref:hypothetical protein n=1 Tax=Nonomuraea sp. NPDC049784 TaxID=3154361 RepID=UPI0033FFABB8